MKGKMLLIFVIIALATINIFTLIRFNKLKEQNIASNLDYNNQNVTKDEELNAYKANFKTNLLNSGLKLNSFLVKDSLNRSISIDEIFNEKQEKILVYRFSKTHCESCVMASMEVLHKWIDSIGEKNILILGNYTNNKIFHRTMKEYGIEYANVYNTGILNIPAEELGYPYFFILDKNLKITNVLLPNKGQPNITSEYLNEIQKKFEDK